MEAFHNVEEDFQLAIGEIYAVYGICMWSGIIHYLTFDKWHNNPFWMPAELFEVIDSRLPSDWHYAFYGYEGDISINAVWGYRELASSPAHYDQLIDRAREALLVFFERKRTVDQFHDDSDEK